MALKRYFFVILLFVIFLTGCSISESSYSITYYIDGLQVILQPDSYKNGETVELPIPRVKEGKEFDGWYLYDDYFGTQLTSIENRIGDIVLYGTIKDIDDSNNSSNNNDNNNDDSNNPNLDSYNNYKKIDLNESPMLEVIDDMCYDSYTGETYGVTRGLPSIGNPKVLVIPVEFTDSKAPSNIVNTLEKAFFGTSEDTGWESLKSYYYKSSYGQLTIDGRVLQPYNTGKNVAYYDNLQKQYIEEMNAYYNYETDTYPDPVEYKILKSVLSYYDSSIDYSEYDYDNDGYIDSVYLVYTTSYDEDEESLWWAFSNEYFSEDYEYYDNVEADFYCFLSYEFFLDDLCGKKVNINSETVIHETGHLLGLDDYYDYDDSTGPAGGIGGGDMMDYNVGDHNAYSKIMLGWIDPILVTGDSKITLGSFSSTGNAIVIFKNYNGTFFDEFLVIDFYTPDGLNDFTKGEYGLFSTSGIRIYHVNAKLNDPENCYSIFELTLYNNSYTDKRLISLIEADGKNDIDDNGYSENSDLFKAGSTITSLKWDDGTIINFKIIINSINSKEANITIDY